MDKSKTRSDILREYIKNAGVDINPLLDDLLTEYGRLDYIRQILFDEASTAKVMTEYTNKAGATNDNVNAAIKEYKTYTNQFNQLAKTIHGIIKEDMADVPQSDDPLKALLRR